MQSFLFMLQAIRRGRKMYNISTNAEVKAAEVKAAGYGLTDDILIENAAAALFTAVTSKVEKRDNIAILCGGGNNGADGLSLARMLFLSDYKVTIYTVAQSFNAFASARLNALKQLGAKIISLKEADVFDPGYYNLIIDAMLGSGINRQTDGAILQVITALNKSREFIIAVDLPSGLNADSGLPMDVAVVANETITFCGVRSGHILGEGRNYIGNLVVANIGLQPQSLLKTFSTQQLKPAKRNAVSHKYNYGRVRIIAGSPQMPGAAILAHESAMAALKSGAGLATLCVPKSMQVIFSSKARENTLLFMPDTNGLVQFNADILAEICHKCGAVAIGMGMGNNPEIIKILQYLLQNFSGTLVIDADGLNALAAAENIENLFADKKASVILTPHEGEFARIKNGLVDDIQPLFMQAKQLAQKLKCVVVLKGASSIITNGEDVYVNTTGCAAMAKGGTGDVLSGMIAAFACRNSPLLAAASACYHFGKCGEAAEAMFSAESVLASHLIIK